MLLIVGIGTVLGMMGYLGMMPITNTVVDSETDFVKEVVNNEIADLKTYRNEEYGFEIKLSEVWKNQKSEIRDEIVFDQNSNLPFITVRKFEISKNQSFEDILVKNTILGESDDVHPVSSDFKLKKIGHE